MLYRKSGGFVYRPDSANRSDWEWTTVTAKGWRCFHPTAQDAEGIALRERGTVVIDPFGKVFAPRLKIQLPLPF